MAIIIKHANSCMTGSAFRIQALAGEFRITICPQDVDKSDAAPMFDWDAAATWACDFRDVGEILSVLHGIQESINDGRGIRRGGNVLQVSHEIEPRPGFRFTILSSVSGEMVRRTILLDCCETLALSEAIRSAMGRVFLCD